MGQTEATNFAKFVANLKDLSASAFVQAFEEFWYGGCTEIVIAQGERSGYQMTGHGDVRFFEGMALIANAFGGGNMSSGEIELASLPIKSQFVCRHKDEISGD